MSNQIKGDKSLIVVRLQIREQYSYSLRIKGFMYKFI